MSASDKYFIDSNIVVYAYDHHEPQKREKARQILKRGMMEENIVLSPQVLGEFYVVVTKKIRNPISPGAALGIIEVLSVFSAVEIDALLVIKGINIQMKYKVSYWDSLILAAAERAECNILLTEDMKDGEVFNNVTVTNPF